MGIYVAMSLEKKKTGLKFERRIEAVNLRIESYEAAKKRFSCIFDIKRDKNLFHENFSFFR